MLIPLKQGLKQSLRKYHVVRHLGLNVDSIKTRIETKARGAGQRS